MAWRLACVVAVLAAQQVSPPAQPANATWPPAGVYQLRDVDTPPKIVKETRPQYPYAALRAHVEGQVGLACVVLADGSVGEVRVIRSVDTTYGIDDAAVTAVRQWRFSPATKAGSPVPVVVNLGVSLTISNSPPTKLSWPEGFDGPLDDAATSAGWHEETFEVLNLRIKIAYPAGWTVAKSPNERQMIAMTKNGEATMLNISAPQPAPLSLDRTLSAEELRRIADMMARKAAEQGLRLEPSGFGQAPAAFHLWAWHAWKMASFVTPNMSEIGSAAIGQMYDGGRMWSFEGTAGDSAFSIACLMGIPRRLSDSDRASFIASRAAIFGEILRRMSIVVVP